MKSSPYLIKSTKTTSVIVLSAAVFFWSLSAVEFSPEKIIKGIPELFGFLYNLYPPDTTVAPTLLDSALETIQMVIVGTTFGAILAFPLAAAASSNISPKPLVIISRSYLMIVRTIPSLVWALIFVIVMGLGPLAGVFALTFYTLGYLGKLNYEAIESIDMNTVEGVVSVGANGMQIFSHAILPQVLPYLVNNFFFMIEYNIRHASILGFVGAGGIGFYIFLYLQSFSFDKVAMALLVLLGLVIGFDRLSLEVRKKLTQ